MKIKSVIFSIALATVLIFYFSGCPDKKSAATSEVGFVEENVTTIGGEGGSLKADDFELVVPSSAFDAEVELKLYGSDDQPFGENSNSRTFKVEGLPEEFFLPITIKVKYDKPLRGDNLIALGMEADTPSAGETQVGYRMVPADVLDGYLAYELPPTAGTVLASAFNTAARASSADEATNYYLINGVRGYNTLYPVHFKIAYPDSLPVDRVRELGIYFENAYEKFKNAPFGFDYAKRTTWPIDVTIRTIETDIDDATAYGAFRDRNWLPGYNNGWVEINKDLYASKDIPTTQSRLKTTVGHEFFHFIQHLYFPAWSVSDEKYRWLGEACSTWSEEKFTTVANYTPPIHKHKDAPLLGVQAGTKKYGSRGYGYGMSTMIKYLVSQPAYGENTLRSIYEKVTENKEPFAAVIESTSVPDTWWHNFLAEYALGNVYSVFDGSSFINVRTGLETPSFLSGDVNDTRSYPDLSGRLFRIDKSQLSTAAISDNTSIRFDIHNGLGKMKVTVFEYQLEKFIKKLAGPDYAVTITEAKRIKDDGSDLIILVSNARAVPPYTGTTEAVLQIRMQTDEGDCPPGMESVCEELKPYYGDEDCSKYSSDFVEYRFCLGRNYRCAELKAYDEFGEHMYNGCLWDLENAIVWDDPDAAEAICNLMDWQPTKDQCLAHVSEVRDLLN